MTGPGDPATDGDAATGAAIDRTAIDRTAIDRTAIDRTAIDHVTTDYAAAREHLAIALDTADLAQALDLAEQVSDVFGVAKVGLQLFSAEGARAVRELRELGLRVFLDVKLHDIPNTVEGAGAVLGRLGANLLTVHAAGGVPMLEAARRGLAAGAAEVGLPAPSVLAVTVLTSDPGATVELLLERADAAVTAGCPGVVCAASDLAVIRARHPGLFTVVPGIRPAGAATHDQVRVATPGNAIRAGADLLVIGRAVTTARDPMSVARSIADDVAGTLAESY